MSAGSGVSSLDLKQVAGSVTITNKRTGSVVFTGNHTNSSGTYNIPGSELASGQDTEFEVKGITIDDEVGTDSVTVFLKKASIDVYTNYKCCPFWNNYFRWNKYINQFNSDSK